MLEPIFITGYPKTGTTLIAHMFNNLPDVLLDIELHYAPAFLKMMEDTMNSGEIKTTTKMNDFLAPRTLELSANDFEQYIQKCKHMFRMIHTEQKEIKKLPLQHFHSGLIDEAKWRTYWIDFRWGNNCKQNANFLGLIRKMYPKATIISMIRDPRDVWASIKWSKWPGLEIFSSMDFFLKKFRKVYDQIQNSDSHVLRYEDLLNDPQSAFSLIDREFKPEYLKGAGMIYIERTLQKKHPGGRQADELITSRIGRYKSELSGEEIEIINLVFRDVIGKYYAN